MYMYGEETSYTSSIYGLLHVLWRDVLYIIYLWLLHIPVVVMYMYCEETSYTSSIYGYYMYQEGSNVHVRWRDVLYIIYLWSLHVPGG